MLLTYLITGLVVAVVLIASFRALGGGQQVGVDDYQLSLARLAQFSRERGAELAGVVEADPSAPGLAAAEAARPPAAEMAGAARKKLGGYGQQLARLEALTDDATRDRFEPARVLLVAGIEDLAWACRLVETGRWAENPALREAVEVLREHGGRCLADAEALIGTERVSAAP